MHYVVQDGLYNQESFVQLVDVLERAKLSYSIHKIVPFSDIIIPEPDKSLKHIFAFGAGTMSEIAKNRNWIPGVFLNDNFDYQVLVKILGDDVLNSDAKFSTFGRINIDKPMFIRPVGDTKSFTGGVFEPEKFKEWQTATADAASNGYTTLRPKTWCLVAEPKEIIKEIRFFVVDGEISTYSTYKFMGQAVYSPELEVSAIEFAYKIMKIIQWSDSS